MMMRRIRSDAEKAVQRLVTLTFEALVDRPMFPEAADCANPHLLYCWGHTFIAALSLALVSASLLYESGGTFV